jgi:hypothetical protein
VKPAKSKRGKYSKYSIRYFSFDPTINRMFCFCNQTFTEVVRIRKHYSETLRNLIIVQNIVDVFGFYRSDLEFQNVEFLELTWHIVLVNHSFCQTVPSLKPIFSYRVKSLKILILKKINISRIFCQVFLWNY